jgi:hypothetical protein
MQYYFFSYLVCIFQYAVLFFSQQYAVLLSAHYIIYPRQYKILAQQYSVLLSAHYIQFFSQ